jgi:Ca-activated chloride channel family protein
MILDSSLKKRLIVSNTLFLLFLILVIIAIINPRWGMEYIPTDYRRGLDIVIAIDVSNSMDIRDVSIAGSQTQPVQSRLERGLFIARQAVHSVPGARYAIAIGRARGYLAVPLTFDNETSLTFLESFDGSSMTGRSTNLEALLDAAISAFQSTSPAQRVIILISDGEAHSGILRNAINYCVREGIIINTVAVGSDEGRLIPMQMNNPDAEMVISRRNASVMFDAAERTNGIYIDAERDDAGSVLSSFLLSLAQEIEPGNTKKEPKQRRTLFIVLALITYGISKFVTRQLPRLKSASVSIIAFVLLITSCSQGKLLLMEANYLHSQNRYEEALIVFYEALNHENAAPYAEYGIGLTLYLLDQNEEALKRYNDSQRKLETLPGNEHRELRYRNHYNSGIILFENEDFTSAASAFREALRVDPRRIDAKRNLELTLLSIAMETRRDDRSDSQQEQREILFDYLRQEEQQFWRSREWAPEENFTGPDY